MTDFKEAIRLARQARGWSQRDLGQRIDMSQRAVSSWERGVSEPDNAMKARLYNVLGLRDPAAPESADMSVASRSHPGRALLSELPFDLLAPDEFEDFAADLLDTLYQPRARAYRVGSNGHTQGGYDVLVEQDGALLVGAQCKRVKDFGPGAVDEAVRVAKTSVDQSVIFLSRVASPAARTTMRKHQGWQLWDCNDLSRKVRALEPEHSIRIVRHYFPRLLSEFLGVEGFGHWMEPGEYLHRMNKGVIYTHRWQLVGREAAMESLLRLAKGGQGQVKLLVGPGGAGKTKILTSLCETLDDAETAVAVRVLNEESTITQEAFDHLPSTGKLLVIIDDAHNESLPLGSIVAGVKATNSAANILLSLRPYGVAHARRELARTGLHASEAAVIEVDDLEFDEAASLASEVLDPDSRHYAARLAAAARDCPLLIVTGGALINRGALDPRNFESDERLHTELTDRLADVLAADSTTGEARQELLYAIAAYQPVHLAEQDVRTSLENLTGLPFDSAAPHLSALEEAGVLLRYGDALRVVPDLLGDALLIQAARHRSSGLPTGYLTRAMEAAAGSALRNLVVNAGRVDWQERATGDGDGALIEPLWARITADFRAADALGRVAALEVLAKVAFFQPRRALELATWTVENPSDPITMDVGLGMTHTYTDTDVQQAMAPVLQAVAYHVDFLPQAAGLLWRLGRDDMRPTNQHPHHPLRVLEQLASFTRLGPTDRQRVLIAQVERWLGRAPDGSRAHQPLTVLAPLLATEGHEEQWTRDSLVFRPYFLLPAPAILELRATVLELVFAELGSPLLVRASAAVTLVGAALTLPRGGFGANVPDEVQQAWVPHLADIIDRLRLYIAEHVLAPAILVAIRSELHWLAKYGPDGLREPANMVLAAIPTTPDNELARALHGGPTDPADSPDLADWHQAQEALFASVIKALAPWSDDQTVTRIEFLLSEEQSVFGTDAGRARPFVWDLVTGRPSVGEKLCERALSAPTDTLVALVSITLIAMGRAAGERAVNWGRQLAARGSVELVRETAHAFGIQRGRTDLHDGEADLLRELAANEDPIVRACTLGAARYITALHKDLAIDLLTASLSDGAGLGEFAMAFADSPHGALSWSDLSEYQKEAFIERLATSPSIDSYEILQFLATLARTEPITVVRLLETRVEASDGTRIAGYSPLPFVWHVQPPFRDHPDFPDLLRQIREWLAAEPDSAWRSYLGADVFALVAGPYDAQVIAVIDEYLNAPDPIRLKIAATILRKAGREVVWNIDFVRRCLRSADRFGDKVLNTMQGALYAAVITGMRSGTPGQPYPEDIEQHAKATALADTCIKGTVEELFYRSLVESAQSHIQQAIFEIPPDDRAW